MSDYLETKRMLDTLLSEKYDNYKSQMIKDFRQAFNEVFKKYPELVSHGTNPIRIYSDTDKKNPIIIRTDMRNSSDCIPTDFVNLFLDNSKAAIRRKIYSELKEKIEQLDTLVDKNEKESI